MRRCASGLRSCFGAITQRAFLSLRTLLKKTKKTNCCHFSSHQRTFPGPSHGFVCYGTSGCVRPSRTESTFLALGSLELLQPLRLSRWPLRGGPGQEALERTGLKATQSRFQVCECVFARVCLCACACYGNVYDCWLLENAPAVVRFHWE